MRHEEIRAACQSLGKKATLYDGMITYSTLPGKLVCGLVWKVNEPRDDHYLNLALSGIPEDFSGRVLEVPVGAGILAMSVYRVLPRADITCLGHSTTVMEAAQRWTATAGLSNVRFTQGDVGSLPSSDNTFDLMLSLNGFHALLSKEAAYRGTFRVLKPGGVLRGCSYVQGEQSQTNWFTERLYVPRDFFTPPFKTTASLENKMRQRYAEVTTTTVGSMGCFCCIRGSEGTITHKS